MPERTPEEVKQSSQLVQSMPDQPLCDEANVLYCARINSTT